VNYPQVQLSLKNKADHREAGKRDQDVLLLSVLNEHTACMPRTMLRCAIEKLTAAKNRMKNLGLFFVVILLLPS
jgi:hypothetical protein